MDKTDLTKIAIAKELRKKSSSVTYGTKPSTTEEAYFERKNKELVEKLNKKKA